MALKSLFANLRTNRISKQLQKNILGAVDSTTNRMTLSDLEALSNADFKPDPVDMKILLPQYLPEDYKIII